MNMKLNPYRKYIRKGTVFSIFCPGCGCGQILNFFVRAAEEINLDFDKLVGIGGVGCAARIPVYMEVDALHGVHGRTLPWATGIKLHNPDLKVVIFAGDGDAVSIGGNHFIHAARRNLDVTVILVNNLNYGMTGGQVAPTTFQRLRTMTTPYGNREKPFDIAKLAIAAGATFVSRWNTHRAAQTIKALKKALQHKGFSLVEIVSQCSTNFGRYALGTGDPIKVLEWIEERSITIEKAKSLSEEECAEKFILGNFVDKSESTFEGNLIREIEECR
ncbi:MAG: 2-oxoacid:ferredoxin oxidoreductase subunit beta [Deltaproteobacteria bacterium]|nr:2-oxoacid:ferredoxin oxidoreductase subunit beta [Deltaproteobacteria bacterium]